MKISIRVDQNVQICPEMQRKYGNFHSIFIFSSLMPSLAAPVRGGEAVVVPPEEISTDHLRLGVPGTLQYSAAQWCIYTIRGVNFYIYGANYRSSGIIRADEIDRLIPDMSVRRSSRGSAASQR